MHNAWIVAASLTNARKKKKKKETENANANTNVVPKRSLRDLQDVKKPNQLRKEAIGRKIFKKMSKFVFSHD